MRILMVTGDRNILVPGTEAHGRLELQRSAGDELVPLFWGTGSTWPKVPSGHFDIVTVQDPFFRGLYGLLVALKKGARFNVQVHTDLKSKNLLQHVLALVVLRCAHSVRVVSDRVKAQVSRYTRAPISVLPVFVDVERFRHSVHVSHAQKIILWVGRFEKEKDPFAAVSVLRTVLASGIDAKLIMLGKGNLEERLKAQTRGLPVEFPGWQDPIFFYARADVVLSTSPHESWGASIVEALTAGVPVVAPDVGVAREAGAHVVPRERLAGKVEEVLTRGERGKLTLDLPGRDEWIRRWRDSL